MGSEAKKKTEKVMKKAHGCAVCGEEFPMGQALGGHMTRHRLQEYGDKKEKKDGLGFDLNSPPMQMEEFFWDVPMIHFF